VLGDKQIPLLLRMTQRQMGLHQLADRPVGRPQDLERHKSRVWAAQLSQTAATKVVGAQEALMRVQRRREELINAETFLCQNRPVSVARKDYVTVRHGRTH